MNQPPYLLFELSDKKGGKSGNEAAPKLYTTSNINYLSFRSLSFHDTLLLLIITVITTTTTAMAMTPTITPAAIASVEVVVFVPGTTKN